MEDLSRTIPDWSAAATALDALFDVNPARASQIAEERLLSSLLASCVPAELVALLARRDADPFRAVEARLMALGCKREALRPRRKVSLGYSEEEGKEVKAARAAAERLTRPECRKGFENLFGLAK